MESKTLADEVDELCENDDAVPILVLASRQHGRVGRSLSFNKLRVFEDVDHQTCGNACHHVSMFATKLTPRPEIVRHLKAISDRWYDTNLGVFGVSLDSICEYRRQLKILIGADCNRTYADLQEGLYPIDCDRETLGCLASDDLPADLDDLVDWQKEHHKAIGIFGRWDLFILGPNSD